MSIILNGTNNTVSAGNLIYGADGIHDETDSTKIAKLDVSGITTGTTRTIAVPNASGTMALGTGSAGGGNVLQESAGSTTPSVSALVPYAVGVLQLLNTGTYTITNFTGGVSGQILVLVNIGGGTITVDRSNCYLDGSANQTLGEHDSITLVAVGSTWRQIGKLCANG